MRVLKRNKPCIPSAALRTLQYASPILVRPVCWPILSSLHHHEILPAQPFLI